MKAIRIEARGCASIITAPLPKLESRDEYVLVRTTAVAVNPSDWKHVDFMLVGDPTGSRPGLDYAGVVVDVGKAVTQNFKKGDRVFGIVNGSNKTQKEDGTFAEYTLAKAQFQIKIPDSMTDIEATTLGSGLVATGQGLYQSLALPLPTNPSAFSIPLLIYGGSTSSGTDNPGHKTSLGVREINLPSIRFPKNYIRNCSLMNWLTRDLGVMGIQLAKLSNCNVIATCSPKNFEYLKSLGADHVLDYHSENCGEQIRKLTRGNLRHAWDCIATVDSARLCARAMSEAGGHYSSLLFLNSLILKKINPKIKVSTTLGYTIMGERFEKETVVEVRPEDYKFGLMWWKIAEKFLKEGKIKGVRQIVNEGGDGLEGVLHGMELLKLRGVSGGKLVYTMPNLE